MTAGVVRKKILDPDSGILLHEVIRKPRRDAPVEVVNRVDFSDPQEFLQGAIIEIPASHSFRAHVHLERNRAVANFRAQECWVVLGGQVEVDYFTDSGDFITTEKLDAGDITISFRGGHGYRTITTDALVYEFKSGPYEGQQLDKIFLT